MNKINRTKQLQDLIQPLSRLVQLLEPYGDLKVLYRFLAESLNEANSLLENGFTQDSLNRLSANVYQFLKSKHFDYYPFSRDTKTGELVEISEKEEYFKLLKEIEDKALELRVIGTY